MFGIGDETDWREFSTDVAGESFYAHVLWPLREGRDKHWVIPGEDYSVPDDGWIRMGLECQLVAEPANPVDHCAVRVEAKGRGDER